NSPFRYDQRAIWPVVGRVRKNLGFKVRVITKAPVTLSGCQIRVE
ncbi:DNA stabilization domain protein, partial [Pectobacterium parmentieri]